MKVKIDTREKFHVITIQEYNLAANMTEKMEDCLIPLLNDNVKNAIINIRDIKNIEIAAAEQLIGIQNRFQQHPASFVVCEMQPQVKQSLSVAGLLELINITPTESEAVDIVQLEELEREMLND